MATITEITTRKPRYIALNFSLSKKFVELDYRILEGLRRRERTYQSYTSKEAGKLVSAKDAVLLVPLLSDLRSAEYVLVNGFLEKRAANYVARYVFAPTEFARSLSAEFRYQQPMILAKLSGLLCEWTIWHADHYENPFVENEKKVDGVIGVEIVMNSRKPLCERDGSLIKAWQRDANGHRIGTAPILLATKNELRFLDGKVQLVAVG